MRRIRIIAAVLLCTMAIGCGKEFAKQDYDNSSVITEQKDRYTKSGSVLNAVGGDVSFTADSFDGRETLWNAECKVDGDIQVEIQFTLSSGQGKIVHINESGQVTTVVECRPDSLVSTITPYTVKMQKGNNRFKFVGYDCKNVQVILKIK